MALFKVRSEFHVHKDGQVFAPGAELELNDEQLELVAHQVEPVIKPTRKARTDGNS